jgi:RND family efflux transporter MFP subunit
MTIASGNLTAQNAWVDGVVKPYKAVIISASLREIIRKIEVSEGERIKEGQMLVRLESEKQRLSIERYALVISKATFDQKAAQRLFEQNVASRDDAMNKDIELKRLQVEQDIAKAELADREIKSPINGVVVRKLKESGESVNETEPILQIMETDRLLLLFYLQADMLASVKLGQEIATRYPELSAGTVKKAVVDFIDPEVDARSGLFRVRLLLDNKDDSLKPGMRVQAEFPASVAQKPAVKQQ